MHYVQTDGSVLASDGACINFLSCMYDLSRPITLDKVQPMYAFHPQSRVRIADDETRLKMTPDQVRQFVATGVGG